MNNIDLIRQMGDRLQNMENDMLSLFKNVPILFVIADKRGNLSRLNPEWTRYLGWTEEELTSQPWLSFVHPDDVQATIKMAEEQDEDRAIGFVNRYRAKDGTYKPIKWYVSKWIDGKNYGIGLEEY